MGPSEGITGTAPNGALYTWRIRVFPTNGPVLVIFDGDEPVQAIQPVWEDGFTWADVLCGPAFEGIR